MAQTPEKRRTGRGLKWALGLSLALNLIIVGFVAGAAWRFSGADGAERKWRTNPASYGTPFVRALPKEARRAMFGKLRASADVLPSRQERRTRYAQIAAILRADDFDGAAIEAVFAEQSDTATRVLTQAQSSWLEIVSDMSAAERREVADRLEQALARGPKRDKP
ncbi:MAG: periplasmic heavy metal sensor [Pseudomonadota bacterium]